MKNKIDSLQFVRAFAAIWVLITHVFQRLEIKPLGNYYLSGQYGVDVFFILSGFIISALMYRFVEKPSMDLANRLLRINNLS